MQGDGRRDVDIYQEVCDRLETVSALDTERLSIRVGHGRVVLLGAVDSFELRQLAEQAVLSVQGVQTVENRLSVEPPRAA